MTSNLRPLEWLLLYRAIWGASLWLKRLPPLKLEWTIELYPASWGMPELSVNHQVSLLNAFLLQWLGFVPALIWLLSSFQSLTWDQSSCLGQVRNWGLLLSTWWSSLSHKTLAWGGIGKSLWLFDRLGFESEAGIPNWWSQVWQTHLSLEGIQGPIS